MFQIEGIKDNIILMQLWSVKIDGEHVNHQWEISRCLCSPALWIRNFRAHVNDQLRDNLNVTLVWRERSREIRRLTRF